jgi:PASTA domain-containing protein
MPKLPLVGDVPKGWVIGVGAVSAGVLGYAWYKHRSSSSSTTAASTPAAGTGDPYPPDGTTGDPSDPNSTDPATGLTYGDEQMGSYGYGYGGSGYAGYGGYGGGYPGATPPPPGGGGFTTNGQWAQQAETDLGGIGVNQTTLAAALGKYLTGQTLDSDQQSLVDQAIALEGYPPVAGPGNYPPNMKTGGTGGGGGKIPVPNVVGQNWAGAIHQITAAGLKPSPGAKPKGAKDPIKHQSPAAGSKVAKGSTVKITGS